MLSSTTELAPALIGHLVSRVVVCGGGGLNPCASGIEFMLSPRVAFLRQVVGGGNEGDRPIFHNREEAHAKTGGRLHITCGDRNLSHTSLALRFGTTALVALLAGRGLKPPRGAQIRAPLRAINAFARDPDLHTAVCCLDGTRRTALELSRLYCEWVAQNVESLPVWASDTVARWRDVLDRLEARGWRGTEKTLDWAITYSLFVEMIADRGWSMDAIDRVNRALRKIGPKLVVLRRRDREGGGKALVEADLDSAPVRAALQAENLSFDDVRRILMLRAEIAELFTRYGELDDDGVFRTLDRAGVLDHRVVDRATIASATQNPPIDTRAVVRGRLVREGAGSIGPVKFVNWGGAEGNRKRLDLSDPFDVQGVWQDLLERGVKPNPGVLNEDEDPDSEPRNALGLIRQLYDCGDYKGILTCLGGCHGWMTSDLRRDYFIWAGRARARLSQSDAAASVAAMSVGRAPSFSELTDHVLVCRWAGLEPSTEIDRWIATGQAMLAREPRLVDGADSFFDHLAYTHTRRGDYPAAVSIFERLLPRNNWETRIVARIQADFGDALRANGRLDEADEQLNAAETMQSSLGYGGELFEFSWTNRGKLAAARGDYESARTWFERACAAPPETLAPMPHVRLLVLQARVGGAAGHENRQYIERLSRDTTLNDCRLLKKILANWGAWIGGQPPPDAHPDKLFWGV